MVLTGLGVTVVTTTSLYHIGCLSDEGPQATRTFLDGLHDVPPGIVTFDAGREVAASSKHTGEAKPQGSLAPLQRFLRL